MYGNPYYELKLGSKDAWIYAVKGTEEKISFSWPQFEVNGKMSGIPQGFREIRRKKLTERITEIVGQGKFSNGAMLTMELRVSDFSPIFRFRYILSADKELRLTKTNGERLEYGSYVVHPGSDETEVRLSGYDYLIHGYQMEELAAFKTERQLMGPILTEQWKNVCMLTAYEHGSQYPDKFVVFEKEKDRIFLRALRGNYWNGQSISGSPYETIWLQAGAVNGDKDELARAYRAFQLKDCTLNSESRKPYIFYNTWAFQERNKFYNHQTYLTSMNQKRIESEIEIAYRMGVDVYVIDTGWYKKTGDWEVNMERFPDGLVHIREKLESYQMKLGLWLNPTAAAKTSQLLKEYPDSACAQGGKEPIPFPVWETEDSYPMCLVSKYWNAFADRLIELVDTIGVKYFKWDAVDLYGCERDGHFHGGEGISAEESRDCYAFQIGLYMSRIVDKVCKAHPDVIVDVDITEGNRYFGLGFLSSGKFFSMNNGPYFSDYDIEVPENVWTNIFVHPGPARGWICRQNLCYDKWIPSVLLMAHYLPDQPESSQMINIASLILGQNGIWGDLSAVSDEGIKRFSRILSVYKRIRDDITEAYPFKWGHPGSTLEVHEKINSTQKGVVVIFANMKGKYEYQMQSMPDLSQVTIFGDVDYRLIGGKIWFTAEFREAGAAIIFFE